MTLLLVSFSLQYTSTHYAIEQLLDQDCTTCNVSNLNKNIGYIPKNSLFFKQIFPADPDFIADILWLKTAYYFGLLSDSSENYSSLPLLIDTITDLSPKWRFPYLFASIIFTFQSDLKQEGYFFIDKGIQNLPEFWELWLLKSFCFWKIENDYEKAAEMMANASKINDAPPYLASLATTLALKTGNRQYGIYIANEVMKYIHNEQIIKRIMEKIN